MDTAVESRAGGHRAETVLVVEDSRTQREALVQDLVRAGFRVLAAASAEEALAELDHAGVDLVVSDIVMGDMDGYQLCRRIKASHPDMPVILLTSLSDPIDVVHGLEAGADNFVRKPYEAHQLLGRIQVMLHHQQLRRDGHPQMGLQLDFLGKRFMITAERQQILGLLISTFEDLVEVNGRLREREQALAGAYEQLDRQLAANEAERRRLEAVLDAVPGPMVTVDADGVVTGASGSARGYLGCPSPVGKHISNFSPFTTWEGDAAVSMEDLPLHRSLRTGEVVEAGGAFDLLVRTPDGSRTPVLARSAPVHDEDGRITGAVGFFHEIGALAAFDPITRLPRHAMFAGQVRSALAGGDRGRGAAAVLVVVPDRLHQLRSGLDAEQRDALVRLLADRLGVLLGGPAFSSASAAYLGDHEFAILLPDSADPVAAVRAAELLVGHLGGSTAVGEVTLDLTVSVGVCTSAEALTAPELVAAAAAAARSRSAHGGDGVELADRLAGPAARALLRQEQELRRAIQGGQLVLHYQPQVQVRTGATVGFEALLRWQHPERGLLPPSEFLPLAEQSGLIVPMGWWALREACRQLAAWRRERPDAGGWAVAVNLSFQQLNSGDLTEQVRSALADSGLPPSCLHLEITESGVTRDPALAAERLRAVRALGVRLALDDFGTGYASLRQLREFPIDILKVDRSFVAGMRHDGEDAAIVAATIGLGHALGLRVLAEGVEVEADLLHLRRLGCDSAQGYHWAPALAPGDLVRWLGPASVGSPRRTPALPCASSG